MRLITQFRFAAWLLPLILAAPALAYRYPLSADEIREAYFLGLDNGNLRMEFFAGYIHRLPPPKTGPYIATISILTPFAQVVEHSGSAVNYSAQDAVQQFLDKPSNFRVRVEIYLTTTYSALVTRGREVRVRPSDFWRNFKIKAIQDHREIHSQKLQGHAMYGEATLTGATVEVEYQPEEIEAMPITIEVLAPDGHQAQTTFDLAKLR